METISLGRLTLTVGAHDTLFSLAPTDAPDHACTLTPPQFELDGLVWGDFVYSNRHTRRELPRGGQEITLHYDTGSLPKLRLTVLVRAYPHSPIIRFQYRLNADQPLHLTKATGHDRLTYFTLDAPLESHADLTELTLSHFDPVAHSYLPGRQDFKPGERYDGQRLPGPIVLLTDGNHSLLTAYEHGADYPDSFLAYEARSQNGKNAEGKVRLALLPRKGNYHHGQVVSKETPFVSVWFELGLMAGGMDSLLRAYRQFFLDEVCENTASRQPNLYYNTWNYQERMRYFHDRPYLESMTQERILAEIDVAHKLGLDVFVIDTGWYEKTGDWIPNHARFPDGLQTVKRKLDEYGMKLGLWFNPIVAAKTSKIYLAHPEYVMSSQGKPSFWGQIWETEESYGMCLASDYADTFIETMVRLNKELGVVYFKWDAIGQYGCDAANHHHGTEANSREERADCYAYEMGRAMIRIADEVGKRCSDVIVDFDITEDGRFVGLGFLAVGKYFLVNNGPYFHNFDIPNTTKVTPDTINVFFYPGPARSRVCRTGARYDFVIPSILFLTHYLPDAPALSQANSAAALLLGGNGIWGDLPALSKEDVARLAAPLHAYKAVGAAVTRAYPRTVGFAGSSPEVHEKLDPETASGMVVFFTVKAAEITHVTQPLALGKLRVVSGADHWERLPDGRVKIVVALERNGARPVFFTGD